MRLTEWLALPAAVVQVMVAAILLRAALSKAITLRDFRSTLLRLGVVEALVAPAACGVVGVEFLVAVALLVEPESAWPRALVVALGFVFAGAGALAIVTKRRVACRCFGTSGRGRLGWRQVWLLPVWVAACAAVQIQAPAWDRTTGLLILASGLLALIGLRLSGQLRLARQLREDRMAIAPAFSATTYRGGGAAG